MNAMKGTPMVEARRSSTAHSRHIMAGSVAPIASASLSAPGTTAVVGAAANRVRLGDSDLLVRLINKTLIRIVIK